MYLKDWGQVTFSDNVFIAAHAFPLPMTNHPPNSISGMGVTGKGSEEKSPQWGHRQK